MTDTSQHQPDSADEQHLAALGHADSQFRRSMTLWANLALGFTYLSPLVGVISLWSFSLSLGGPPAIFWIFIAGGGQLMVALVFGEVVSQYPLAGGIYPWMRRLWNGRAAWLVSWIYLWALIVTITAVAEYGGGFVASLLGVEATPRVQLATAVGLLMLALLLNFSGTKMLATVAKVGLAAELTGVIALGLYLIAFKRSNPWSVFVDSMGAGGEQGSLVTFLSAALVGLFLFYGFEACGDVAEEVADPTRRIPVAMVLTVIVGGVSALVSYAGYVLAAPDLRAIIEGRDPNPIPSILNSALGSTGQKIFLCVVLTAFISCVLSLQAAGSRLLYASARDRMLPRSTWLSHMSARNAVPANALLVCCIVPAFICLYVYADPSQLPRITAFAVLGIYLAFQAVVLAALRQRHRGWRPAGRWSLGRYGYAVNVIALGYGLAAMALLLRPATDGSFADRYIVAIGLAVVVISGLSYLWIARPDRHFSGIGEGDAIEVATRLRSSRRG